MKSVRTFQRRRTGCFVFASVACGLLASAYALLWILFHPEEVRPVVSRQTTFVVDPVRDDGDVDFDPHLRPSHDLSAVVIRAFRRDHGTYVRIEPESCATPQEAARAVERWRAANERLITAILAAPPESGIFLQARDRQPEQVDRVIDHERLSNVGRALVCEQTTENDRTVARFAASLGRILSYAPSFELHRHAILFVLLAEPRGGKEAVCPSLDSFVSYRYALQRVRVAALSAPHFIDESRPLRNEINETRTTINEEFDRVAACGDDVSCIDRTARARDREIGRVSRAIHHHVAWWPPALREHRRRVGRMAGLATARSHLGGVRVILEGRARLDEAAERLCRN